MKVIVAAIALVFVTATAVSQTKPCVAEDKNPYPNELPTLKIYRDAKWKSLRPFVSTNADIDKVLGKPVPSNDDAGYNDDFEWTIVVRVVGKGGELPDSVVDRLDHLILYPKRRVSLVGADFSAFMPMSVHDDSTPNTTHYYDACGLRYVVYSEDAPDGRFHVGDLKLIVYGASRDAFEKLTHKR